MNDRTDFEGRLTAALATYAEGAPVEVDAVTLTSVVAGGRARGRWSFPGRAGAIGRPASRWAALLIVLGLTLALLVGAIVAGAFRSDPITRLVDGNAIVPTGPTPASSTTPAPGQTISPNSLPTAQIPPGLHPSMTPREAAQQVLDEIAQGEQTLGYVMTPAKIVAIRLMPPGSTFTAPDGAGGTTVDALSWAVTAEGTFVLCGSECSVGSSLTEIIPDDGVSGGGSVGNGSPAYDLPSKTFLSELERQGQVFRPLPVPTSGIRTWADVYAIERTSGLVLAPSSLDPILQQTYGPIYGLVSCVDQTKGCRALGADPAGPPLAIWWVRFPTDAGAVWIALDAPTGKVLERSSPIGVVP
jgi:hypothetical protein